MISNLVKEKVVQAYDNRPLVIEGANGSMGLSILDIFNEMNIRPSHILVTTSHSDANARWGNLSSKVEHIRFSESAFIEKRKKIISNFPPDLNVIYGSGYGRPNFFLDDPISVINANITSLLGYSEIEKIGTFAYMSTSEIYSGSNGEVSEDSLLPTTPQHPRAIYIESKRLGEAIVSQIMGKKIARYAIYRIALATPPVLLQNDKRVLADLINSAIEKGFVQLNGGASLLRQYQYGPNAAHKMIGSLVNGYSTLYNNAGSHILSLGELANLVAKIFNVPCTIKNELNDSTSPHIVLINSNRINKESEYKISEEKNLEFYLRKIINA